MINPTLIYLSEVKIVWQRIEMKKKPKQKKKAKTKIVQSDELQ